MGTAIGHSAATTLGACGAGAQIMLAGRDTGSDTLLVLAYATMVDAFADTGASNNGISTTSNGSDWFHSDTWSRGVSQIGVGRQPDRRWLRPRRRHGPPPHRRDRLIRPARS